MKLALALQALITLLALAISFPRILPAGASSKRKIELGAATSCMDRYNSLLKSAKVALIAGNRATSAGLLEQAKRIIPFCPALQDIGSPQGSSASEQRLLWCWRPTVISSAFDLPLQLGEQAAPRRVLELTCQLMSLVLYRDINPPILFPPLRSVIRCQRMVFFRTTPPIVDLDPFPAGLADEVPIRLPGERFCA